MNAKIAEIKDFLKKNKMTYKYISEKTGIPEGTLKNIFSGFTKNPRIDTIQAIEEACGINKTTDYNFAKITTSNDAQTVAQMFQDLTPRNQEVILKNFYILLNPEKRAKYDLLKNIK